MKLGFTPSTALMLDVDAAFRLADELRLDFIELGADLNEFEVRLQDPKRIRELKEQTGVGTTVHLQYVDINLCSLSERARRTSVDRILSGLEFGAETGASVGVLHSGLHYFRHPLADPRAAMALATSLEAIAAADSGVRVVLENLALTSYDFVREPEGLLGLLDGFGFDACLDFGHANVERSQPWRDASRHDEDLIGRYIELLGSRITHLHLHNNDGSSDQHRPTDDGEIPYERYARFLAEFTGTACLEIATGEDGIRASVAHLRQVVAAERV